MKKKPKKKEHIDGISFHYMRDNGIQVRSSAANFELADKFEELKVDENQIPKETVYKTINLIFGITLLIPKDGGRWELKSLKKTI